MMPFARFQRNLPVRPKRESKLVLNAAKRLSAKWAAAGAMISRRSRRRLFPARTAYVLRVWQKLLKPSALKNHEALRLHID